MKTSFPRTTLLLAAALALLPLAKADETTSQIAFSDPAKPGTLKIHVWHGEITIHGADVKEISVQSDSAAAAPTPRKDGMRVLSSSAGFVLSEKNNVALLEYGADGWTGGSTDFEITVPRDTSIVVANSARGDFECDGVSGDLDVRTMSGDVKLSDVTGGALVEAMRGDIIVGVKALTPSKPLSFTSMRGEIIMHLPTDAKANVRFRTHRGVILTNFDDKALVTKSEVSSNTPRPPRPPKAKDGEDEDHAGVHIHVSDSGSSSDSDNGDWHVEVRDSIREAARDAAEAAREAAEAMKEGIIEINTQFDGPMPPLPPMTGGKVVAGTLNGGGVEIQAATLTGDIELKKSE
jgi:hypothetical protein